MSADIKKEILNFIVKGNKEVGDVIRKASVKFDIDVFDNNYVVTWIGYPTKKYVENALILLKASHPDINIELSHQEFKNKTSKKEYKKIVEFLNKENLSKNADTEAYRYIAEYGTLDKLKESLNYTTTTTSYITDEGKLSPSAKVKLREIAVKVADSENNTYITGDVNSPQITNILKALDINTVKKMFTDLEGRKLSIALRKHIENQMESVLNVKFGKGIAKKVNNVADNDLLTDSYTDAVAVGSNFNPLKDNNYGQLIKDLRANVVAFDFLKADGTHRRALGTRNEIVIRKYLGENIADSKLNDLDNDDAIEKQLNGGYIIYFDLDAEGFRTFRLYPNGKGGNQSRLLSCVTNKDGEYVRGSWHKIPVTDFTWVTIWDGFVGKSDTEKEDLFKKFSKKDGTFELSYPSEDLIVKFNEHTGSVLKEKLEGKQLTEDAKKSLEEATKVKENETLFNSRLESLQNLEFKILTKYPRVQTVMNNLFSESKEKSLINILLNNKKLGVKNLELSSDLVNSLTFVIEHNKYYIGISGVYNITNGIIYSSVVKKDKVFPEWNNDNNRDLNGYEIGSNVDISLRKLSTSYIKTIKNAMKGVDDEDLARINRVSLHLREEYGMDVKDIDNGIVIDLNGKGILCLKTDNLAVINTKGESVNLWVRDEKQTGMVRQLRNAIDLVSKKGAIQMVMNKLGVQVGSDAYVTYVVSLDEIRKKVWGSVDK